MTAKSASERHKKFLKDGFFAPELPPAFDSSDLATKSVALAKTFNKLPLVGNKHNALNSYQSKPATFRFPRFKNSDRRHSIVNPVGYFALSKVISEEYVQLRKIARTSAVSATPPMFDWDGERAIKRPSFEVRDKFSEYLMANYEYSAATDISAFYHSVYTHSIPWAIHGKKLSKQKKQDLSLVGNLIDKLIRNSQDGQTIGLPVGPDTSRLVAELIASAIDCSIQEKLQKMKLRGLRLVDDFLIGCATRSEAEKIVTTIRKCTNAFELELNSQKTQVLENLQREELGWKDLIKKSIPPKPYKLEEMRSFFFEVSQLQHDLPNHNILKFAVGNARSAFVNADEWTPVQRYLISAYKQNSTLISIVAEILIQRHKLKNDIEKSELTTFLKSRLPVLGEQLRNGEATWLLYLARVLSIPLPAKIFESYFIEKDCLTSLQICDADRAGLIKGEVDYAHWNSCLTADDLNDEMWLYAYETTLKKINKSTKGSNFVKKHDFFGPFYEAGVSFYRPDENQPEFAKNMRSLKHENSWNKKIVQKFVHKFPWNNDELTDNREEFDDFEALIRVFRLGYLNCS
jgi:Reverse transcriptase (RNA-dependent DNA polymerase)